MTHAPELDLRASSAIAETRRIHTAETSRGRKYRRDPANSKLFLREGTCVYSDHADTVDRNKQLCSGISNLRARIRKCGAGNGLGAGQMQQGATAGTRIARAGRGGRDARVAPRHRGVPPPKILQRAAAILLLVAAVAGVSPPSAEATPTTSYEELVAAATPSAWFRFADASGSSTIADGIGPYTAADSGLALGQPGPFGANKSGANPGEGFASLPGDPLAATKAFTVEAWIRRTGTATVDPVFAFGSSGISQMELLAASNLTKHKLLFEINAGTSYAQITAPVAPLDTWEYVAVTETSTGTLTLYVNGEQTSQLTGVNVNPSSIGQPTHDYLARSISEAKYLTGSMSNLAFYRAALTHEQILQRYEAAEVPLNTSLPAITGTTRQGKTLKAKEGSWTGLEPISFEYHWLRCQSAGESCAEIPAATGSEYTLANADVGQAIRIAVTATNSLAKASVTSEPTEPTLGNAPDNTSLPVVTGSTHVGQLISTTAGAWEGTTPLSYRYQWQSCKAEACANIGDGTEPTFRIQGAQLGRALRVVVTAENVTGNAAARSAETTEVKGGAPVNVTAPSIFGPFAAGQQLNATTGSWAGSEPIAYAYEWRSCDANGANCSKIAGASAGTYTPTAEQIGHTLQVVVTASNGVGLESANSSTTAQIKPTPPTNTSAPTISGTPQERSTLTVNPGAWTGTGTLSYTYKWKRCAAGAIGTEGNGPGEFHEPADVVEDSEGSLWVLDAGNDRIEKLNRYGLYISQIGSPGSGEGQLYQPSALAIDKAGDIWVADTGNNRVEEFSPAGSYIREISGFGESGASLETPEGVAVDRNGDIVVADSQAGQLVLFGENGGYRRTIGHQGSGPGALNEPGSVTVDSTGHIYATDWLNDRIDEFNEAGEYVREFGSEKPEEGSLEGPYGIAVTPASQVLVGDVGKDRVDAFSATGQYTGSFGTEGMNPGDLELELPLGIAASSTGDVWITDTANNRLEQFTQTGEFLGTRCEPIPGATTATYVPTGEDTGDQLQASVTAKDSNGEASQDTTVTGIVRYAPPTATAPPELKGPAVEGETLTATTGAWLGSAITYSYDWQRCDSTGANCVDTDSADQATYRLGEGDLGKRIRVAVTARNPAGEVSEPSTASASVAPATPANVSAPTIEGPARDGEALKANVGTWSGTKPITYSYQWESCNSLKEGCIAIPGATETSYRLPPEQEGATIGLIVTASNAQGSASAAASPTPTISGNPPTSSTIPGITGNARVGQTLTATPGSWQGATPISFEYGWQRCITSLIGAEGTGPGQFIRPGAVALDPSGDLWVADYGNDRVEEFNAHAVYVREVGSPGSGAGHMNRPSALATDASGDLYVADSGNNRVEEFSAAGAYIREIGAEAGQLHEPEGLAIDARGDIWVSDTGDGRIQEYNAAGEHLKAVALPAGVSAPEPESIGIDLSWQPVGRRLVERPRHRAQPGRRKPTPGRQQRDKAGGVRRPLRRDGHDQQRNPRRRCRHQPSRGVQRLRAIPTVLHVSERVSSRPFRIRKPKWAHCRAVWADLAHRHRTRPSRGILAPGCLPGQQMRSDQRRKRPELFPNQR